MTNDYKEKILEYLKNVAEPADVEKIRVACKIGNWQTSLKHLLELHVQGAIQGQKTSKGWVFWIYQETHLVPWQEAIGVLDRLETSETQTIALLTCTFKRQVAIPLSNNQPETEKLQGLIGQKIRILKTDIPEKPLIIRTFTASPVAENKHSWQPLLRRSLCLIAFNSTALKFALRLFGLRLRGRF